MYTYVWERFFNSIFSFKRPEPVFLETDEVCLSQEIYNYSGIIFDAVNIK